MKELHWDGSRWHLKNTCPACSYQLHGEKKLIFDMLITMDGNNSLKRMRRDVKSKNGMEEHNYEQPDSHATPGDYYLTREEVDRWKKGVMEEELMKTLPVSDYFT